MNETVKSRASKRFWDLPDSDVACASCNYCLRGQPRDGRCPECGTPIADSAAQVADRMTAVVSASGATDERRASDLRWGPWLILGALVVVGLTLILAVVKPSLVISQSMVVGAFVLAGAGVYASTRPAQGVVEAPLVRWTRRASRLCALVAILLPVVLILLTNQGGRHDYGYSPSGTALIAWLMATTVWFTVIGSTLFYLYAMRVAIACRSRATAISCGIVAGVLVIAMGLSAYEKLATPANRATFGSRARGGPGLIGSGFVPSTSIDRNLFSPASAWSSAITMAISALFHANGWWSVLTLVQLGFMSARPVPADLPGSNAASSRP